MNEREVGEERKSWENEAIEDCIALHMRSFGSHKGGIEQSSASFLLLTLFGLG